MKHPIIDKILTEWACRVHNGKPNKENPSHILELKKTMEKLNLPKEFIFEFVQNLFEKGGDRKKKLAKSKGLKNIQWNDYEDDQGNLYRWSDSENDFVQQGKSDKKDKDTKDKPDGEEKPPPKPKVTSIDKHQFTGDVDDKKDNTKDMGAEEQKTYLRNTDHKTTDAQLNFTKAEAKAQAKQKGEKGVGLGTPESRAGEAAVHYAMRELTTGGKTIDEVSKVLTDLAKDKDKVLDSKWAKAAVNTAKWISQVYGDDIGEVVWDTPEGRELIGAQGHGTSSDMFIQTKNGKNIGISLKQTTNVFLLNGGYAKQHDLLVASLGDELPTEELENFKSATSIDTYWNGDDTGNGGFIGDLKSINTEFSNNKDFKNLIKERVQYYRSNPEVYQKGNVFDSDKYEKYINQTELIIEKLPHVNGEQMKYIGKICKDPEVRKQFPQFYDNLRGQEVTLTKKILGQAKSSPNVAEGLKKLCLKGMHVEDILFGSSEQLDEFITLYGNDPAVELDKGILLNMFGMKEEYEKYLSISDTEDPEGYMREEQKENLMTEFNKRLIIDMKDDAKAGEIKIKHSGPPEQEFHLFGLKARAKALGASPALEMNQTSFMGNVIKEGTADVSKWKPSTKKRYVSTRMKELSEELIDANSEQKQAIQQEIKALREL